LLIFVVKFIFAISQHNELIVLLEASDSLPQEEEPQKRPAGSTTPCSFNKEAKSKYGEPVRQPENPTLLPTLIQRSHQQKDRSTLTFEVGISPSTG
jgi:hypothetical protein